MSGYIGANNNKLAASCLKRLYIDKIASRDPALSDCRMDDSGQRIDCPSGQYIRSSAVYDSNVLKEASESSNSHDSNAPAIRAIEQ